MSDEGHPLRTKLTPVAGFSLKAIAQWASSSLAPGVRRAGLLQRGRRGRLCLSADVVAGRKPKDLPEFEWINTVLGNLKTSLTGAYHAFDFRKYAHRCLAAFAYHFNRRFNLRTLHKRLLVAAANCGPQSERIIRMADVRC